MNRANELGITSLSQTDHGSMAGHREFYFAAREAGVKPILGVEAYISSTDRFDRRANAKRQDGTSAYNHVTLLAQNQTGLTNLYKLSEIAWTEGFYGKPRIDTDILETHSSGLIVLTGCLNGIIAKRIELGDDEGALEYALRLKDIFGENVFMEVQSHNPPEINHKLLALADSIGMEPAMASDCHYANQEDLWIEEAMLIMATKPKLAKDATVTDKMDILEKYNYLYPERKMSFQELELYLRSYDTERDMFARQGIDRTDIFENTNLIADRVSDYEMPTGLDLLPKPKYDPNDRLITLVERGLKGLNLFGKTEYDSRAELELRQIIAMNQASYFLVVADMSSYCKKHGIRVGPGRGSAAGSLVLYALGITNVDPIKYGLLFARFVNAGEAKFDKSLSTWYN